MNKSLLQSKTNHIINDLAEICRKLDNMALDAAHLGLHDYMMDYSAASMNIKTLSSGFLEHRTKHARTDSTAGYLNK